MEAHLLVIIDRWGKCRLSTVPLKTGNDGTTAGLPQALACIVTEAALKRELRETNLPLKV